MIPSPVQVTVGAMATDGGSVELLLVDAAGGSHRLRLTQHLSPSTPGATEKPGRLYLNGELIGVRSQEEAALVELLRQATIGTSDAQPSSEAEQRCVLGEDLKQYFKAIDQGPDEALQFLIVTVVKFVESDEYVANAAEAEGEADL